MPYLTHSELKALGFKKLGVGVKISDKASIYDHEKIEIGDYSRIDDFCVISGKLHIGKYCHITPMCLLAGGELGIEIGEYSTLAYGVKVFSQSDDYSGETMVNSLIPKQFKNEYISTVVIGRQCVLGANTVVMPGVQIADGTATGAMTLVNRTTLPWGIYVGSPAKRLKCRSKKLLELETIFSETNNDTI